MLNFPSKTEELKECLTENTLNKKGFPEVEKN